ncbi:MAG: thioredoxin family protein [Flavobacteriaceae bacterium]|nr:thioredoxin family protein [Flavobacteriaceae bacterium]
MIEESNLKALLESGLAKSMSYKDYRDMVAKLVEENGTTGVNSTQDLVAYTKMNNSRMKRWDKTLKLSEDAVSKIVKNTKTMTWLVLTESWCGDAAHIMPVLHKVAEQNDNIDFKVVLRDENTALIDAFLTNGGRSIPKLIVIDNTTNTVIDTFGPRPSTAAQMAIAYKNEHGQLTPEFKEDLQRWYNKDKGQTVVTDVLRLF